MMIASPTAASPAATVMMKIVKICPSSDAKRLENATRLMLTAFIISSTAIRTVIMLRRMITPTNPIANSVPDNIKYAAVLGIASGTHRLLDLVLGFGTLEHVRGDVFLFDRGELAFADHDRADHGHEQEERRDLERDEVVGVQRHRHRFGIADHFAAPDQFARHGAVGILHFAMAIRVRRAERLIARRGIVVDARPHQRDEEDEDGETNGEAALPEIREDLLVRQMADVDQHDHE